MKTTNTRGLTALITTLIVIMTIGITANAQPQVRTYNGPKAQYAATAQGERTERPRNPGVSTQETNQIMEECPFNDGTPRILWRIAHCDSKRSQASMEALGDACLVLEGNDPLRALNSGKQCRRMADQAKIAARLARGGEHEAWAKEDADALEEAAVALENWRPAAADRRPAPTFRPATPEPAPLPQRMVIIPTPMPEPAPLPRPTPPRPTLRPPPVLVPRQQ